MRKNETGLKQMPRSIYPHPELVEGRTAVLQPLLPFLHQLLISRERQEFDEALRLDHIAEELRRVVIALARRRAFLQFLELFVEDLAAERAVDDAAVGKLRLVADPLPYLAAADLGGGGVLHQIVERHAADAAQPGFDIAQADIDVAAQAGLGDGARRHLQKIG